MKFRPEHIGLLVRPRVLSHVFLYQKNVGIDIERWWKGVDPYYRYRSYLQPDQLVGGYDSSLPSLFAGLSIGDTSKDLSTAYVGVITSFIVYLHGQYYHMDSTEKATELEARVKRMYGKYASLSVAALGIRFYMGMAKDPKTGKIVPVNPWEHTDVDSQNIWFYRPIHVIPVENVIRYEAIDQGDLVCFKRTGGIVVTTRVMNKKKFFKTSSWSTKTVTLLNSAGDHFIRFLPNKQFQVKSSSRS